MEPPMNTDGSSRMTVSWLSAEFRTVACRNWAAGRRKGADRHLMLAWRRVEGRNAADAVVRSGLDASPDVVRGVSAGQAFATFKGLSASGADARMRFSGQITARGRRRTPPVAERPLAAAASFG
jgi:hypothetical protein